MRVGLRHALASLCCAGAVGCGGGAPASGHLGGVPLVGSIEQAERPDDPTSSEQFRFDPGDVVSTFDSPGGRFKLHFAREGRNAVPGADADRSGVPDFVEEAAGIYDEVVAKYTGLGFRAPVSDADAPAGHNGGDARFDVYFIDFDGGADGAFRADGCLADHPHHCYGYMVQENDFAGYGYPSTHIANRILASHEFFHAVQAAYNNDEGSVFAEGSAVWATETFDASLGDFEGFIGGYFNNPDRTLNLPLPGPVDPFSYGSAIFFEFLSERFGAGVLVELWTACDDGAGGVAGPLWLDVIDAVLEAHDSSFADAFVDFASRNLFTGWAADPSRGYARGRNYPDLKMTEVTTPYTEAKMRVFIASTQYYRLAVDGQPQLAAALVASAEGASSLEGLSLVVAFKKGRGYVAVTKVADASAGTGALDPQGADSMVVAVINTNRTGNSKKPGLCLGTPAEVAACRTALTPKPPPDPTPAPPAPSTPAAPKEPGCGCAGSPDASLAAVAMAFGQAWRRRRARNGSTEAQPKAE